MKRRNLFKAGLAVAGGGLLASVASAQKTGTPVTIVKGKRRLGQQLEVSSRDQWVDDMPRTYATTVRCPP